ncbi:MAG: tryptophan synthase subunit alpha [Paludibacteraceae bacterium]|nr:tryptophan synthase subunit alpha [Paludibacteraceae bacterium]
MNRIDRLFASGKKDLLSVYFTAGYPHLNDTVDIIRTLSDEGVDMIEIGMPFSDPMADGPVIQHSSQVALENGISQKVLFEQLKDIRRYTDIPLVLMGYINPVLQFGFENLCKKAVEVGIDGFIIPDIPLDIYRKEFAPIVEKYGLRFTLLVTPETPETRVREIDAASSGFVYLVSSASTTGAQSAFNEQKQAYFKRIEAMGLRNPLMVGFGVSNKETFEAAAAHTRGCIVGSAFVKLLQESASIDEAVKTLVQRIRG